MPAVASYTYGRVCDAPLESDPVQVPRMPEHWLPEPPRRNSVLRRRFGVPLGTPEMTPLTLLFTIAEWTAEDEAVGLAPR